MASTAYPDTRSRTIAYLGDPMPTRGPEALLKQLHAVRCVAAGRTIDLLVVDSGSRLTRAGRGANLDALVSAGARVRGADTVIVEGPHRLGADRRASSRAVKDLLLAGFVLKDASGELHPTGPTTALAAGSARLQPSAAGLSIAEGAKASRRAALPESRSHD